MITSECILIGRRLTELEIRLTQLIIILVLLSLSLFACFLSVGTLAFTCDQDFET